MAAFSSSDLMRNWPWPAVQSVHGSAPLRFAEDSCLRVRFGEAERKHRRCCAWAGRGHPRDNKGSSTTP